MRMFKGIRVEFEGKSAGQHSAASLSQFATKTGRHFLFIFFLEKFRSVSFSKLGLFQSSSSAAYRKDLKPQTSKQCLKHLQKQSRPSQPSLQYVYPFHQYSTFPLCMLKYHFSAIYWACFTWIKTPLVSVAFWTICPQSGFWQSERASVFVGGSPPFSATRSVATQTKRFFSTWHICAAFSYSDCFSFALGVLWNEDRQVLPAPRVFRERDIVCTSSNGGGVFPPHSFICVCMGGNTVFTSAHSRTLKHKSEYVASVNNVENNCSSKPPLIFFFFCVWC